MRRLEKMMLVRGFENFKIVEINTGKIHFNHMNFDTEEKAFDFLRGIYGTNYDQMIKYLQIIKMIEWETPEPEII